MSKRIHTFESPPPPPPEEGKARKWEKGSREKTIKRRLETQEVEELDNALYATYKKYVSEKERRRNDPKRESYVIAKHGQALAKTYTRRAIAVSKSSPEGIRFPETSSDKIIKRLQKFTPGDKGEVYALVAGWNTEARSIEMFRHMGTEERVALHQELSKQGMEKEDIKREVRNIGPELYMPYPDEDIRGGVDLWVDFHKDRDPKLKHLRDSVLAVSIKYRDDRYIEDMVVDPIFSVSTEEEAEELRGLLAGETRDIVAMFERDIENIQNTAREYNDVIPCIMLLHPGMGDALKRGEIVPVQKELVDQLRLALSRQSFVERVR